MCVCVCIYACTVCIHVFVYVSMFYCPECVCMQLHLYLLWLQRDDEFICSIISYVCTYRMYVYAERSSPAAIGGCVCGRAGRGSGGGRRGQEAIPALSLITNNLESFSAYSVVTAAKVTWNNCGWTEWSLDSSDSTDGQSLQLVRENSFIKRALYVCTVHIVHVVIKLY